MAHIPACKEDHAMGDWDESVVRINKWLDSNTSYLDLSKSIVNILQNWKRGEKIVIQERSHFNGVERMFQVQRDRIVGDYL